MPESERVIIVREKAVRDYSVWNSVFSAIVERARLEHYKPGAKFYHGTTEMIEDSSPVKVVVNPTVSPFKDGLPDLVTVNLYDVSDPLTPAQHFQQFTARSFWKTGVPEVLFVDELPFPEWEGVRASMESAALLARRVATGNIPPRIFPVPRAARLQ